MNRRDAIERPHDRHETTTPATGADEARIGERRGHPDRGLLNRSPTEDVLEVQEQERAPLSDFETGF